MIKNTIFKKVKSIQSKSNSKLYKNFGETTNQKNKLKNDSSDRNNIIQYELNNNFNNNNNNNNSENHPNFLTITIEKESLNNDKNFSSDIKLKKLNDNVNLNQKYQIKNKYILIDKQKNLSPKLNHINNAINLPQKKIARKSLNGNLINFKKNNNNFSKKIKEKVSMSNNSQNAIKLVDKIIIDQQEKQTIKSNDLNNESFNLEKKESFHDDNNNKHKYKHYNLKLKQREKSLTKKNKLPIEEEKTIVNDINFVDNLNIMNYIHKLSNTAQNNNRKINQKIIIHDSVNLNEKIYMNNNNYIDNNNANNSLKSNLSINILNSDKKKKKEKTEIIQNNKLMKQRELDKKITKNKIIENINIDISENKEKKNQNDFINSKLQNKKIIKKNLIKKRSNINHEKDEINQNISNNSINKYLLIKIEDNHPSNIHKTKKIKEKINNSYFSIMKKKEFKEMKSDNFSVNNKLNKILLVSNISEEQLNINKNKKNENLNTDNYYQTYAKQGSKKNAGYLLKISKSKKMNNSTNNIHKRSLVNEGMLKIKMNNDNKENSIKKYSNKNRNIKINFNDFKRNKMKRSISPNTNKMNNINIRNTTNNNKAHKSKLESNLFLNEIIIDFTKVTCNNNEYDGIIISKYNQSLNNTTKNNNQHNHYSPKNATKSKQIYSSLYSRLNDGDLKNLNVKTYNFNSTYRYNKRNTVNKNNMRVNMDNIFKTDNKLNLHDNKEKMKLDTDIMGVYTLPDKKVNFIKDNKKHINFRNFNLNIEESSISELQIPSIPEENIQIIPLKTMKYNNRHIILPNKHIISKMHKILKQEKIIKCIILYLTNEDLYHLSLVNYLGYKIVSKLINNIIYHKISKNINDKNFVKKIWKQELLKYSDFNGINNIDLMYKNYLKKSNNKYDKEIIKDLLRTFPNDSSFQRGSPCYQKLFNILKAYSNYNNEIGYAQGMNFIVAKLIKFFNKEKESFIYLDSLFNKLKMVEVIGIKNNLEKKMKTVQFLLKELCPDILFFLERKKINHEIFTAKWYITLFSQNFKFDNLLMIIWNFAIIYGWKFIFLFSISVIISFKARYINLDLYDFTQYMKNIFVFENFQKKFKDVMKLTFYYMSQWKTINQKMDANLREYNCNKNKEFKNINEKDEEENNDNIENNIEKEEIIFNDDYAFS